MQRLDALGDWMGMDWESIRQDKELVRGINQMTDFLAEQIALQGKDDEIRQMRSLVEALNLYWGADGKEDCTEEFDEKIQQPDRKGPVRGTAPAGHR